MNEDGTAVMFTGVSDMGNGSVTTQTQVVSEILGIPMSHIECVSRPEHPCHPLGYGELLQPRHLCALQRSVKGCRPGEGQRLLRKAAGLLGVDAERAGFRGTRGCTAASRPEASATLAEVIRYAKQAHGRDICCADTFASCAMAVSYGAHFAKVQVDMENGSVKVLDYTAVHDIGKALNPMGCGGPD